MYHLQRPLHPSWLLSGFFFGVIFGTIGARWIGTEEFSSPAWLIIGAIIGGFGLWRQRGFFLIVMILAGSLVGLWRGAGYLQNLAPLEGLVGDHIVVKGKLTDDPDKGKHGEIILRLGSLSVDERPVAGTLWISTSGKAMAQRSDLVTVSGTLSTGFGSFTGSVHRASLLKVERPQPGDVPLRVRNWYAGGVRDAIPEPEASLGLGFITGMRRSMPEELNKSLQVAGLTHIVVASGYNLTILVGMSRRFFENISKYLAAFFSGSMIIGFIAVTGLSPSMSRAGLVAGLSLLAWYYGRRFHPLVLLLTAAAITLFINPTYGWGDLGWQLSFASFAGVLMVAPLLQQYFYGEEKPGAIRQVLGETISAWLCTLPLIIISFGQFSNIAIIANMLVLPLVPLAMLLTFIAGLSGLLFPPLAGLIGLPATFVLGYMTRTAEYLGNVPWAQTELTITPITLGIYYAMLIGGCGYLSMRVRRDVATRPQGASLLNQEN